MIFLPQLTPMLNPADYFVTEIKKGVKSKVSRLGNTQENRLIETLEENRGKDLSCYFRCMQPYVKLALQKLPFK